MKRSRFWSVLGGILVLSLLIPVAVTSTPPAVFKYPSGWPIPPEWHGNPFGPDRVGGIYWMIYEPLFYYVPGDDSYRPGLGMVYACYGTRIPLFEACGKTIKVILREALWHDGTPFTSKDVVTHFKLLQAVEGRYIGDIDDITAPNDCTVVFTLKYPVTLPIQRRILGEAIFAPDHIFGKFVPEAEKIIELREAGKPFEEELSALYDKITFKMEPVGTGPFKFRSVTATEIILDKFPDHWTAETNPFDMVIVGPRWVGNEVVWAAFMAGEIDAAHPASPPDIVKQMEESIKAMGGELKLALPSDLGSFGWILNFRKWPYNELNFRKALAYIQDPDEIRKGSIPGNLAVTSQHGILQSLERKYLTDEFLATLTKYTTNREKAEELLKGLGFTKSPAGIWQVGGKDFEIWLRPYAPHTDWVWAAEVFAEQLKAFGFKVKFDPSPHDTRTTDYPAGKFDIAIEFREAWWGTAHPASGYERIYSDLWWQGFNGYEKWPVITLDDKVYDTKALVDALYAAKTVEEMRKPLEDLAFVTNEWLPGIAFQEKRLQMFHVDGIRVTGWPPPDDPIWTIGPGGAERVYVQLLRDGVLKPVR